MDFVLDKYGSLDLYDKDLKKRFFIDHKKLQFDTNSGWNLIGILENPNGYLLDHEYFCINDELFDRIQSTHQDNNIMLKFISNESNENESQCEATEIYDNRIQKKKSTINKKSTNNTLQRKSQKFSVKYREKSFDEFRIIVVEPTLELDSEESDIIYISFGVSIENQSNKVISKILFTHISKRWEESKHQLYPSSISMTPSENISPKLCCIILKYNNFTDISSQTYIHAIVHCCAL